MYFKIIIAMLFTSASIYSMKNDIQEVDGQWLRDKMGKYVKDNKNKQRRDAEVARLHAKPCKQEQFNNQEQYIARRFGIAHGCSLAKL